MINLPNVKGLVVLGKTFIMANRPEILFGASITATLASVGLAAKGGYEAGQKVMQAEHPDLDLTDPIPEHQLDLKQKASLTWLCYAPAAVTTIGALGSTTGLHIVHISEKRALAQAALGAIEEVKKESKAYIDSLEKSVDENAGPKTADKIREGVREGVPEWMIDEKLYLVQDEFTGRTFYSNETRLMSAVNEVNKKINKDGECDLNTFYMWAGVEEIDRGVEHGWSGELLQLQLEDEHLRSSGDPVRKFIFRPQPTKGFDSPTA